MLHQSIKPSTECYHLIPYTSIVHKWSIYYDATVEQGARCAGQQKHAAVKIASEHNDKVAGPGKERAHCDAGLQSYMPEKLSCHCGLYLSAVHIVQHKQQDLSFTLHLKFLGVK